MSKQNIIIIILALSVVILSIKLLDNSLNYWNVPISTVIPQVEKSSAYQDFIQHNSKEYILEISENYCADQININPKCE